MFKPGQSGNPGGRPKGEGRVREAAREHTDEALGVLVAAMQDEDVRVRIKAAETILERGWGKPPQAITGEDGEGPARMEIGWTKPSA
jgi:hypothetical protein